MKQLVYKVFLSNNRASFHLWLKKNLVKHQKVSKYYEVIVGLMVIFSKKNFLRIKDEAYVINLDDRQSKGTH